MAKKKKREEKRSSLQEQFSSALPHFLPMIAGGLLGGMDTGVAAQEGANQAMAQQAHAAGEKAKLDLENRKLDKNVELKEKELALKARGLEQDAQIAAMTLSSQSGKKKKMTAEQQKRLDSIQMGQVAIEDLQSAMDRGVNKFSVVGDNEFTFARSRFVEGLGRMQSGAVISKDEEERFASLLPGVADSEEISKIKMQTLRDELARRFESLTGEESELAQVSKQTESLKEMASSVSIEELQAELQRRRGK